MANKGKRDTAFLFPIFLVSICFFYVFSVFLWLSSYYA
jgi:hypothetical protein